MDQGLIAILVLCAFIALSVFGNLFKRKVSAAVDSKLEALGSAKAPALLAVVGKTVIIHAALPTATQIVNDAIAKSRRYKAAGDLWNIKYVSANDLQFALRAVPEGSQLRVIRGRSYQGMPAAVEDWETVRALVATQATAVAVATSVPEVLVEYVHTPRSKPYDTTTWDWAARD